MNATDLPIQVTHEDGQIVLLHVPIVCSVHHFASHTAINLTHML